MINASIINTYVAIVSGDDIEQDYCERCFATIVTVAGESDWWHRVGGDLWRSCAAANPDADHKKGLGPRRREFKQLQIV